MLTVKNLDFAYGSKKILKDISFEVNEGEIVSILGCNGAGKTTLLKCLCGIYCPKNGAIEVNGQNALAMNSRDMAQIIGYVPQRPVPSRMTVFDAVLMGRRPHIQISAGHRDYELVAAVIDQIGLSKLSLHYTDEISGGEYQKVQLARALVQEPNLLVLDEPTSALDVANSHAAMQIIYHQVKSRHLSTIMTMHDINLAVYYSDRFIFIKNGRLLATGGREVITADLIKEVYGIDNDVIIHEGRPFVIPKWAGDGVKDPEAGNNVKIRADQNAARSPSPVKVS